MRYLLLSSCLVIIIGCSSVYKNLQKSSGDINVLQKFKPEFTVALYNTKVDVIGNHLSGLLLVKKMPDSTTRIVFYNEMGFTFFDFEFSPSGEFKVHSIVKQMNKKAVIKTLRHNFELVLIQHLDSSNSFVKRDNDNGFIYYGFTQKKGNNYYITDSSRNELIRMERASKRKPVVEAIMKNYVEGVPDTIGISHKTFNFTIGLKRIER